MKKLVVIVAAAFGVAHLVRRKQQERPAAEVWREATRAS
ncbi:DLW-39 family protein [Actinomycetospora sp. NBRC 106378]|nr:DLW-39 family protein [Actinomycetospora sp. NBRC 106378]